MTQEKIRQLLEIYKSNYPPKHETTLIFFHKGVMVGLMLALGIEVTEAHDLVDKWQREVTK